ncbi:3'-5' exoribonuclease YhaM family protein [Spiroplasma endosymbiont of Crioceris asparagi]|uniref:3'-5' exoribonuclease YhaM family protein n=1 Tax=Spiroplasma endosymbiont of Crioceris asparagi TaxID=3066286 RepID=UPI0030CB1FB7
MWIKEINKELKEVSFVTRIGKSIAATSNQKTYLILNFVDNTGRIDARLWDSSKEDEEALKSNNYVNVTAEVNVFKGTIQLKVKSYTLITPQRIVEMGYKEADFLITSAIDVEKEYKNLIEELKTFKNKTYSKITLHLLEKHKEKFLKYPGGMFVHHNVVEGLFWHSISLYKLAKQIKPVYSYAKNIDWELVCCGTILHDLGKIFEIKDKQGSDYTNYGKLIGHISIGNQLIFATAQELGLISLETNIDDQKNQDVLKMQHMIIASHGKKEYGSPIEPRIIEAVILSTLDEMDARIYKINDELERAEIDKYTAKVITENGTAYFKHFK